MIVDSRFEASLHGVRFKGGFGVEPGYYITEVDGLLSGGEVTTEDIPRGFGPGAYDTDNRREDPRVITLRGLIVADSMTVLGRLIDKLGALLVEEAARGRLVWLEFDEWRSANVQRGPGWNITRIRSTGTASFVIRLRAADQRIYGAESQVTPWGAAVEVVHRGGYPAPVVVQVRGDSSAGYTILGPRGSAVVVQRPVTPGSVHTYDGDTGLLSIDGAPQTFGVTRSDRIDIPIGVFTFNVDHGCELRVMFAPTWVP